MKLSELKPQDVQVVSEAPAQAAPMKLSQLDPGDVQLMAPPEPVSDPDLSPVTAATSGIASGATLGWAPALGAGAKTAMDAVTGVNGPLGGGSIDDLIDEYKNQRDMLRNSFAKAAAAHPHVAMAGKLLGGGAALGAIGPAAVSPAGLAATGAAQGVGDTDINNAQDVLQAGKNAATGAGLNLGVGMAAEAAAPTIKAGLSSLGDDISSAGGWLRGKGEDLAEKATGATGKFAEKYFKPGTGRELLDKDIVNFGSSPSNIAENAQDALNAAEQRKAEIVQNQLSGVAVDRNTVRNYILNKMKSLSDDESQTGLVKALQSKIDDIDAQMPGDSTEVAADNAAESPLSSEVPIGKSEEIRKGFDQNSKWDSATDAPTREANRIAANAYREAGEDALTTANPDLGAQFKADKTLQSKLIPVEAAASGREAQLSQSPLGGAGDMVSAASGGLLGGKPGAAAMVVAKRAVMPRIASISAVSADQIGKIVAAAPARLGRFAAPLQAAAARGTTSLGATDYILQQQSQEYREQREKALLQPDEDESMPFLSQGKEPNRKPSEAQ